MDKKGIVNALIIKLEKEHQALVAAAKATYDAATNEESAPENEYDTRGLEASYLAGAQAKRVTEIEEVLFLLKKIELKNFSPNDPIGPTALVETSHANRKMLMLLLPKGGGFTVDHEGQRVQIVTPFSPLGEAVLGLNLGDIATVDSDNGSKDYKITNLW